MLEISLPHALLVIALLLIVIDLFVATEALTLVALGLASATIAALLPLPFIYQVLVGILFFCGFVLVYFAFWRRIVTRFVNRHIAPSRYQSGLTRLVGKEGRYRLLEGQRLVEVEGDLYPISNTPDLSDSDPVHIEDVVDGKCTIAPAHKE